MLTTTGLALSFAICESIWLSYLLFFSLFPWTIWRAYSSGPINIEFVIRIHVRWYERCRKIFTNFLLWGRRPGALFDIYRVRTGLEKCLKTSPRLEKPLNKGWPWKSAWKVLISCKKALKMFISAQNYFYHRFNYKLKSFFREILRKLIINSLAQKVEYEI